MSVTVYKLRLNSTVLASVVHVLFEKGMKWREATVYILAYACKKGEKLAAVITTFVRKLPALRAESDYPLARDVFFGSCSTHTRLFLYYSLLRLLAYLLIHHRKRIWRNFYSISSVTDASIVHVRIKSFKTRDTKTPVRSIDTHENSCAAVKRPQRFYRGTSHPRTTRSRLGGPYLISARCFCSAETACTTCYT